MGRQNKPVEQPANESTKEPVAQPSDETPGESVEQPDKETMPKDNYASTWGCTKGRDDLC